MFAFLISGLEADAGDILRGGRGAADPAPSGGSTVAAPTPAATDAARANARDSLARTTQTLDAMRALQTAARNAAAAGSGISGSQLPAVPNGLTAGGLKPTAPGVSAPTPWTGADHPVESISGSQTTVTVRQTAQQALLQWDTFNVGKETTLRFDQSAGGENVSQWIAFNQVNDISANPTQILGNLTADGQVYIINRNGVIFGGGSQVNARGLTVSSLPINTNLIERGLLNNPDAQFLFTGLAIPAGLNGTPAFTPEAPPATTGKYGDVIIQPGAVLSSPTNSAKVGGRITLIGPNVVNGGSILTPDGQTILAAGLQVGLDGHSSSDPSLRGLDVFVGAVSDPLAGLYAGGVTQDGIIEAPRGSITLAGKSIYQNGALASTTSVSLNGRIDIQASYNAVSNRATANARGALFLFKDTGAVDLGTGSSISIIPEYGSGEKTIGTELALRSQANVSGKTIHMGENAVIAGPNALVSLAAGTWFYDSASASPTSTLVQTGGQVYLDTGALIDVAGSLAVPVPVSQNIVSVDLRSAELADSPLQRLGVLRNATVEVDIRNTGDGWIGTPLADISGFANLIQRSVGQLTVAGGEVSISAGGSVVLREGSGIEVSGGSTLFEGGMVRTTRLITGGRLVDIGSASPDVIYDGIYDGSFTETTAPKYGVDNIYGGVLAPSGFRYEEGYTLGAAGGKLSISAPSMALDGGMAGTIVVGEKQRLAPPSGSTLSILFQAQDTTYPILPIHSPAPPAVTFDPAVILQSADPFALDANGDPLILRQDRRDRVLLSPELLGDQGFGVLTLNNHDGDIVVPLGVELAAPTGGAINMAGSNITIAGTVSARGGKLSFSTYGLTYDEVNLIQNSPPAGSPPVVAAGRGVFTLGATGRVVASGLVVDDRGSSGGATVAPVARSGGAVTILGYSANLASGGVVDVSGGALINGRGAVSYGNGGSLSITAGREPGFSATLGGALTLDSDLLGYSGAKAGSLTITGPALRIGGSITDPRITMVDPERFASRGFGTISLSGVGIPASSSSSPIPGIHVRSGAAVTPVVTGWLGSVGADDVFALTPTLREETVRTPVQLTLAAIGASFGGVPLVVGEVRLESGSTITTDAGGAVSLKGQTVTVDGSIVSSGGLISVEGGTSYPAAGSVLNALPTVHIAAGAILSTEGRQVLVADPFGRRSGKVFAGGKITVTGNILAEAGAILDVSGTSGTLDLPPTSLSLDQALIGSSAGKPYVPVLIDSNGGSITLAGSQMLFMDATLLGRPGGDSATGGSVSISSGVFLAEGKSYTTADANLIVRQQGTILPPSNMNLGVGQIVRDASGNPLAEQGYFSVSSLDSGGIDSLALGGNVRFEGDVSIQLPGRVSIADGGVIYADGAVALNSGQIVLGRNFRSPTQQQDIQLFTSGVVGSSNLSNYQFAPRAGTGTLTINAGLVDIGDLSLDGIGSTGIDASGGDIRGNGTFQMAGDLTLEAGQIYPPTQRQFNIFVYDSGAPGVVKPGTINILPGTERNLPLSAGGTLSIHASEIHQSGTLRAPLGTINLGWDGAGSAPVNPIAGSSAAVPVTSSLTLSSGGLTSVSAIDPITGKGAVIPYGISLDGSKWVDPAGNDITATGPIGKAVNLAAVTLVTAAGATIDISGGGDLYAYRWISGNGGTEDILASSEAFAIVPGYGFDYSPYAPFNTDSSAANLGGQPGYTNSTLRAGDQITLAASKALPAGTYTLLPARYALLPDAVLVTPIPTIPASAGVAPDGSSLVAGYRSNNLDPARTGPTVIGGFEIAPAAVVRSRAEYQDLLANSVLKAAAIDRELAVPRLPVDAGYLSFSATSSMTLRGGVGSATPESGRGGVIDINSSSNILINAAGSGGSGGLVLSAATLNAFGAESLLIGGLRRFGSSGVEVTANSADVTLDNAGAALVGSDIVLISRENLTLGTDSEISAPEEDLPLDDLTIGSAGVSGSGNGALVRVSASSSARILRYGVGTSVAPNLVISGGSELTGGSIVLDSTAGTDLAGSAALAADDVSLNSGQISIVLSDPGVLNPTTGLVLAGDALSSLQNSAKRLGLLSYSTVDVYGRGEVGSRSFESLSFNTGAIRGFHAGDGGATFTAAGLSLGNSAGSTAPTPLAGGGTGSIAFDADRITLEAGPIRVEGYARTTLSPTGGILTASQGSLEAGGDLVLASPGITGAAASNYQIGSTGTLRLDRPAVTRPAPSGGGFGADLTLRGAGVLVNGDITLPSGKLTLHATSGDLVLGNTAATTLDLAGTSTTFVDTIRHTSGGTVNLISDAGAVTIDRSAVINVSAPAGGGNAGAIGVKASGGVFDLNGAITGTAGGTGETGAFSLDAGSVAGGSLASLDAILNGGGFLRSRDYRIRDGDIGIDGLAVSRIYRVSADTGAITVSSMIDASGTTGGIIDLKARGSLTLANGSLLDASADGFDSAGKGGSVILEAGNPHNGAVDAAAVLDLQSGSAIKLGVAARNSASESLGMFTGTLHLRAPRNAANSDLALNPVGSAITGASSILVEGVKLYELTGTGTITSTLQTHIKTEASAFLGEAGTTTAGYSSMLGRLASLQPSLDLILAPGAEIFNLAGDLTLGTTASTATSDWNLETFRFGPKSAPGVLTMRASGDIVFYNALSDGFAAVTPNAANGQSSLWLAPLMAGNPLLPANSQSWSYRLTSGADFLSADSGSVLPESLLASGKGSFLLGKNYGNAASYGSGANFTTATAITNRYQVIRTGSGDIDINAGRNAYILNQFASIYTAGTLVNDPTTVVNPGDFVVPLLLSDSGRHPTQGTLLGAVQQKYFVQYSMAGGNVSIQASNDVARMTRNTNSATGGSLIDDSSRQLPNNWLYRRGYIDPTTGESGVAGVNDGSASLTDQDASTTWWIDFSNFFQSVGTLGGGNVVLNAGNDVRNIDAVAPTNARMPGGRPSADNLMELGGGDVTVRAGNNIDGGVYYVERGRGILSAGSSITTNATRSPSRGIVGSLTNPLILDPNTWLPTTLFLGKGGFDVESGSDLLLGPIANTFLLPQGLNNKFWYKTWFSTYSEDSYVNAISLGGSVTHRTQISLPAESGVRYALEGWLTAQQLLSTANGAASYQPWLRLAETSVSPFGLVSSLVAPTLRTTAFEGDIRLNGNLTLASSPSGQMEMMAGGSVLGLQPTGISSITGVQQWIASSVNMSDSDPSAMPGISSPFAYIQVVGRAVSANRVTGAGSGEGFLDFLDQRFTETGTPNGGSEEEQARHSPGGLHLNDPQPVRIIAREGNIEGFTLFTPKYARIHAGNDIGDVSLYIQNLRASDFSVVASTRDFVAYNANTISRNLAAADIGANPSVILNPLAGDLQISGPGNLEVLAGRTLDLGFGSSKSDGTGSGITSIGNGRNPYLGFEGASITIGAGIGPAAGLPASNLAFDEFVARFATSPDGDRYLAEARGILGVVTDHEGSEALENGVKILSVSPGGAADAAGLKTGDVILTVGARKIPGSYDDSYLLSGIKVGEATPIRILRDGSPLELTVTPGRDLLNLADPALTVEQQRQLALSVFNLVLRDTGRDFNDPFSDGYRNYDTGFAAIKALFPETTLWSGGILTRSRDIRTRSGGDITILAPGGGLAMAETTIGNPLTPPGIVTEAGGSINLFTDQSVSIGIGRIFTLKGGNVAIWSSGGDIAAGSSSRTVSAAPPTRVLIDPQSASVETDLAGLATGGGIGVLATVEGVAPGNVDLIAPAGIIDAGDAGIRVSGNINLAAVVVVNAGNISAGGSSAGSPVAASAPSVSAVTAASNTAAAANSTAEKSTDDQKPAETQDNADDAPSLYTVEVIGYGGGGEPEDEDDKDNAEEGGPATGETQSP